MKFMNTFIEKTQLRLSDEQERAATHGSGPALTLAVPGSGKTTLLLCRTVYLIEALGVPAQSILTVTFSKAAAGDMKNRYQDVFYSHYPHRVSFSTIHGFAYGIVRAYGKHFGKHYQLIEDYSGPTSKRKLLTKIYSKHTGEYLSDDKFEELSSAIGYTKNMMLEPESAKKHGISFQKFPELFKAYEADKSDHHLIDFDDMLTMAYQILKKHDKTRAYYQKKFPYVQVDETQDTSLVQHEIIRMVAGKDANIFMVADDDQSIYGFRGAYPEYLLNFKKIFPKGTLYYLSRNYRCSSEIVTSCTAIISNNTMRYKKDIQAGEASGQPVTHKTFESVDARNDYIANSPFDGTRAILYRNNLSALSIVDALERAGRSFTVKDPGHSLTRHWLVQDIYAFMNLALVPQDLSAFERICFKMNGYISRDALRYVQLNQRSRTVFETLLSIPTIKPIQRTTWQGISDRFDNLAHLQPSVAIHFIETELGYLEYLEGNAKRLGYHFENLRGVLNVLKSIARNTSSIVDFMDRLKSLTRIMQEASRTTSDLKLSTIHASKGLEYDSVFIVDVDYGTFPSKKSAELAGQEDISLLEEERRLFYVGMSRARHTLEILSTQFSGGKYVRPSQFITELESEGQILKVKQNSSAEKSTGDTPFSPGDVITHIHFGKGQVEEVNAHIIRIVFESGLKELSLPICLERGFLRHADS
jgi:DNA helicase-2/ATP-dependent DNA helicase PcrA